MDRTIHITIKSLADGWGHPDLHRLRKASDRRQLCKALLPDAYDDSKCSDASALFFRENSDTTALNESTLRMLVNGNRRSLSRGIDRLGSAAFTLDLIRRLKADSPIRFRDGSRTGIRENLLDKLYSLVRTTRCCRTTPAVPARMPTPGSLPCAQRCWRTADSGPSPGPPSSRSWQAGSSGGSRSWNGSGTGCCWKPGWPCPPRSL